MSATAGPRSGDAEFVQSLQRGLAVICAFGRERDLSLSDVAAATGLTRAAARRFLITLAELGYVRRTHNRFCLLPRVLELGYASFSAVTFSEVARPHVERLVRDLEEPCAISVLEDDEARCLVGVGVHRIFSAAVETGTRLPLPAGAVGRVLLSQLGEDDLERQLMRIEGAGATSDELRSDVDRTARQGFAIAEDEPVVGIRSAAVPIRHHEGGSAALSISSLSGRLSSTLLRRRHLPELLDVAASIEAEISGPGWSGRSPAAGRSRARQSSAA